MKTIELGNGSINLEDAINIDGREFVMVEMDDSDREIELTRKIKS